VVENEPHYLFQSWHSTPSKALAFVLDHKCRPPEQALGQSLSCSFESPYLITETAKANAQLD